MNKKIYLKSIINYLSEERGIELSVIFEILEHAIFTAFVKKFKPLTINITFDKVNYFYEAYSIFFVIKKTQLDISLRHPFTYIYDDDDIDLALNIFRKKITSSSFKRKEIFEAKDIIIKSFNLAEKKTFIDDLDFFIDKTTTGVVKKIFFNYVVMNIEKNVYGILHKSECIPSEDLTINSTFKVYIKKIIYYNNEPYLYLSRACSELVLDLLSLEIPEINNNLISVKSIVRNPGIRSKVVVSTLYDFNPIAICLGLNGLRIKNISRALNNEKVDLILWDYDIENYLINMFPACNIKYVELDHFSKIANLFVEEKDISSMIGEDGLNVSLLNKLTGWKIKILNYI